MSPALHWQVGIDIQCLHRAVFLSGFAKSDKDNISPRVVEALKEAAADLLALSTNQLAARLTEHLLTEIAYDEKD